MQLNGHKIISAPPDTTFDLLTDPDVLVKTMPGLKKLTPTDPYRYEAEMEIGVAAIKGRYNGSMAMTDVIVGQSYRLLMSGQGPTGFVEVNMLVELSLVSEGTDLHYQGEAKVGGTLAGVGQRMLSGVASLIMGQFFNAMAKEAKKR